MKKEYDFSKMQSRKNSYASKLKNLSPSVLARTSLTTLKEWLKTQEFPIKVSLTCICETVLTSTVK